MSKKIISLLVVICLFCLVGFALAQQIPNPLAGGGVTDFPSLLTKIAQQVGLLIASLGTIMLIVAGILYLTSAGSPEKTGVAKKALIYAIVGMAIGIAASTIATIICGVIGATC